VIGGNRKGGTMNPTILVPLDGSALAETALPWARALLAPGGGVTLLRVVAEDDGRREGEEIAREELGRGAAALRGESAEIQVHEEVAVGDAAEVIVRVAAERAVGMIVMASHGRGAIGRWVFGSVADRVARTSPVPVLIVRAEAEAAAAEPAAPVIRRLVLPLDGSPLAEEALPVAADVAARLRAPVLLVQAVDPVAIPLDAGVGGPVGPVSAEIYDEIAQAAEDEAQRTLAAAATQLGGTGVATSEAVLNGSPYSAIAEATRPGDLLVMTSHGRGGVRRWLLGSVAEKLVREGPVPVLLVPTAARRGLVAAGEAAGPGSVPAATVPGGSAG
jgi:nucleotide-binding universal stress UspA family protein